MAAWGSRVHVCRLLWLWLVTRGRCSDCGSRAPRCRQLLSEPPKPRSRDFLEDLGLCWISFDPSHLLRSLADDPAPDVFLTFPDPVLELHEVQTSPSSIEFRWEEAYDVLDLFSAKFFLLTCDERLLEVSDRISLSVSKAPMLL